MITFRLATEEDAVYIGGNLREVDRLEISRAHPLPTAEGPTRGIRDSLISWTAVDPDGVPIAVFGVAPSGMPRVGIVWLLATEGVEKYAREFVIKGQHYVSLMSKLFPCLTNAVDAENTRTRRWLRCLGFTESAAVHGKYTGHPFIPVTYVRP